METTFFKNLVLKMPELPEIVIIAEQMNRILPEKEVGDVSIFQLKCLNRLEKDYHNHLSGKIIKTVKPLGKWIEINLNENDRLLINLGMGGEICYLKVNESPPEKSRVILRFTDGTGFFITLWWFGYFHLVLNGESHPMTDSLGPDPLALSYENFKEILHGRRGGIKSFLLNQKRIRGIGNFYIQEILFRARLHPLREIQSLSWEEKGKLFNVVQDVLKNSIELGSSSYELDFFGRRGKYRLDQSIAYKENAICPVCKSKIQKIKTGSTMQYICPKCQKL